MKAERHFEKAGRFEATQAKLDTATDWETIIEDCFLGAHHYIIAGLEWSGVTHPSTHAHSANPRLLRQAGASDGVRQAWEEWIACVVVASREAKAMVLPVSCHEPIFKRSKHGLSQLDLDG